MHWSQVLFGMVLPWLLLLFACWLGWQLLQQNGRILVRLDAIEEVLAQVLGPASDQQPAMPEGLKPGTEAPAIELPDLDGQPHSLAELKGRSVLVVFFNPGCGFCKELAPALAGLPPEGGEDQPVPLIVTTGSVADNRKLLAEHKVGCRVWIQKTMEVANLYKASGTPVSYLIAANGTIAEGMAVGGPATLALAEPAATRKTNGQARKKGCPSCGKANKGLQYSRLKRDGLPAGTPAPDFRLPRVDGGELSLSDYRDRKVLLVFSDPECGPCMLLAPQLEELHRRGAIAVVLVSRRDPETNRAKIKELGLTFPVVLQKNWEVSREYALFATPIGYLIDEQGVIAQEAAQGVDAILALAAGAPTA